MKYDIFLGDIPIKASKYQVSEDNTDQYILQQYIDSINDQEERKRAENIVRLSRLNIVVVVLISLVIPIGGYIYTRRWKPLLWFLLSITLIVVLMDISSHDKKDVIARFYSMLAIIGKLVAPLDNTLAIFIAKKHLQELSE